MCEKDLTKKEVEMQTSRHFGEGCQFEIYIKTWVWIFLQIS